MTWHGISRMAFSISAVFELATDAEEGTEAVEDTLDEVDTWGVEEVEFEEEAIVAVVVGTFMEASSGWASSSNPSLQSSDAEDEEEDEVELLNEAEAATVCIVMADVMPAGDAGVSVTTMPTFWNGTFTFVGTMGEQQRKQSGKWE